MELSFYQGERFRQLAGQFEQLAALPDVPTLGTPQHGVLPGCFMDMAAVKILGLFAVNKGSNRVTSEVLAFAGAIERSAFGRSVANEHQRLEPGEAAQALRQFLFAVLARSVERCGI